MKFMTAATVRNMPQYNREQRLRAEGIDEREAERAKVARLKELSYALNQWDDYTAEGMKRFSEKYKVNLSELPIITQAVKGFREQRKAEAQEKTDSGALADINKGANRYVLNQNIAKGASPNIIQGLGNQVAANEADKLSTLRQSRLTPSTVGGPEGRLNNLGIGNPGAYGGSSGNNFAGPTFDSVRKDEALGIFPKGTAEMYKPKDPETIVVDAGDKKLLVNKTDGTVIKEIPFAKEGSAPTAAQQKQDAAVKKEWLGGKLLSTGTVQIMDGQLTGYLTGEQAKKLAAEARANGFELITSKGEAEIEKFGFNDKIPVENVLALVQIPEGVKQPPATSNAFDDLYAAVAGPAPKPAAGGGKPQPVVAPKGGGYKPTTPGLIVEGNIDLSNRPVVNNKDGSVSTELSISIGTDAGEVLIPRVINGKIVSVKDAIKHYNKTGEHLGIYMDEKSATAAAKKIHNRFNQDSMTPPTKAEKVKASGALNNLKTQLNYDYTGRKRDTGKVGSITNPPKGMSLSEGYQKVASVLTKIGLGKENWKAAIDLAADIGGFTVEELYLKPVGVIEKLLKKAYSKEGRDQARKSLTQG